VLWCNIDCCYLVIFITTDLASYLSDKVEAISTCSVGRDYISPGLNVMTGPSIQKIISLINCSETDVIPMYVFMSVLYDLQAHACVCKCVCVCVCRCVCVCVCGWVFVCV